MKILLLTDIPPCTNYSGGIVIDQLCRFLPKGSLVCFCVLDQNINPTIGKDLKWIPITYYRRPKESWPKIKHGIGNTMSLIGETYNEFVNKRQIVEAAVAYGKNNSIDRVWAILEGQTMIRIALPVANKLNVPLFTQVWDPPTWAIKAGSVDKISKKYLLKQFEKTIKKSNCCATASWTMQEEYKNKYKVKSIRFLPSLDIKIKPKIKKPIRLNKNEFIIGIAGQLYAEDAWNALLKTLEKNQWKILGKQVKILLLGRYFNLEAKNKVHIEYKGWYSQMETIEILGNCDILYCPYWFSKEYKQEASLSFPSKLITFFAANKPILFHGPKYASPALFLEIEKAGLCCYSQKPDEIFKSLIKLHSNTALRKKLIKNGEIALEKYFSLENLHDNFNEFLNS